MVRGLDNGHFSPNLVTLILGSGDAMLQSVTNALVLKFIITMAPTCKCFVHRTHQNARETLHQKALIH